MAILLIKTFLYKQSHYYGLILYLTRPMPCTESQNYLVDTATRLGTEESGFDARLV
jgi:hypothetical protein